MCMNYSAGFLSVSVLKCALRKPCADPARGRDERCHRKRAKIFRCVQSPQAGIAKKTDRTVAPIYCPPPPGTTVRIAVRIAVPEVN